MWNTISHVIRYFTGNWTWWIVTIRQLLDLALNASARSIDGSISEGSSTQCTTYRDEPSRTGSEGKFVLLQIYHLTVIKQCGITLVIQGPQQLYITLPVTTQKYVFQDTCVSIWSSSLYFGSGCYSWLYTALPPCIKYRLSCINEWTYCMSKFLGSMKTSIYTEFYKCVM